MTPTALRINRFSRLTVLSLALALSACGGGQTPDETPEATATPGAESEAPAESPAAETDEAQASATSEPAKEPEPVRSAKDLLTAPGTMFSFSFKDSEMYQKSEEKCAKSAGDDPQKKADCMNKAREKIEGESMFFKQDPTGKWLWTTIRQVGDKVTLLHRVEFDFGEETPTTITIKPKGRGQGSKAKAYPQGVTFEVDDLGISLKDRANGKMVYKAKLGAVGDYEPQK